MALHSTGWPERLGRWLGGLQGRTSQQPMQVLKMRCAVQLARETTCLVQSYGLPDGRAIRVGGERMMAPEVLFRPSLMDVEAPGVAEQVFQCIQVHAVLAAASCNGAGHAKSGQQSHAITAVLRCRADAQLSRQTSCMALRRFFVLTSL